MNHFLSLILKNPHSLAILFLMEKKLSNIFRINGQPFATLTDPATNIDIGKALVSDGILLVEKRRERKLAKLVINFFFKGKSILKFSQINDEIKKFIINIMIKKNHRRN